MQRQKVLFVGETESQAETAPHIILPPAKVEPLQDLFAKAMLDGAPAIRRRGATETSANTGAHIILPPPKVEPLHEVFAEVILEDSPMHHRRGPVETAGKTRSHIILPPPKVEPLHETFAEAILEDTSAHQHRSPFDWVVSIGVHIIILSALLILPLYYTAGLDFHKLNLTFLATPSMPPGPPPPPLATSAAPRPSRVVPVRLFNAGKLIAPSFIPKAVIISPANEAAPPDEALLGVPGGVPGGIPGGQVGGVFGGVLGGVVKGVPPPPVAAGPKVPVRVGGDVKPPRLLFGPAPVYPVLAQQARLSGVVVIEAVIDEHGNVTGMRVVSGHPLLIPSALSAVSKRKYEPTILDGEPTPIDLRVEVTFSFS